MAGEREDDDVPVDDDLARRLRDLDWPKPPPGVKERSLEEFRRRITALEREAEPDPVTRKR